MKKNFLMVAALLIAAMLMVVSCTQEVAPKNELVEVKLSTVFGRDISIGGGTNTDNLTYKYTMTPNWNGWTSGDVGIGGAYGEKISGIVSQETDVVKDKSLGWVTPGLWTVKVYAYDGSQKVFEGENDAYFSSKNDKVTVYLKPADDTTNSLTFEIRMQDLDANTGNYKLKYTVVGTPSISEEIQQNETSISGELVRIGDESSNNVSMYKLASYDPNKSRLNSLASDYYRVTVSIYDGTTLIGGITKGVLLSNGDTGAVTGTIEPSDYINAQFNVKLFDVKTSLTPGNVTYYSNNNYTSETTANNAKSAEAVITLNDTTTITKYDAHINNSDFAKVSKWYIDGELVAEEEEVSVDTANNPTVTVKDTTPGYKNVSCQTIYYKEVGDVVYYWANTASIQVKFDGNRFAKDSI